MKKNATSSISEMLRFNRAEFMEEALKVIGNIPALILSSDANMDATIDEALFRVGSLFSASRVYIMLNEKDGRYLRNTHEWVNDRVGKSIFSWPIYDCEYDVPSLKKIITEYKVFFGHSREMPQDLSHVLAKQGIQSFVVSPVVLDNKTAGIVGMDFCEEECEFQHEFAMIIHYLAGMISVALERKRYIAVRNKVAAVTSILSGLDPAPDMAPPDDLQQADSRQPKPITLLDAERRIIIETLEIYNGNKLKTAKHLGLTWPSLDRRCKKLGIEVKRK